MLLMLKGEMGSVSYLVTRNCVKSKLLSNQISKFKARPARGTQRTMDCRTLSAYVNLSVFRQMAANT